MGDIKGYLTKTATPNFFKVKYFMGDKTLSEDLYITMDKGMMKLLWTSGEENMYLKLFPTSEDYVSSNGGLKSSGTGFALSPDGYIVTNYHVIEGASNLKLRGINGDFSKSYNAKVIIEDRKNDLALIKINDPSFRSLGVLPYQISNEFIDVGQPVYALGYPLRATMGDEVKLTNGIVSSNSGFQGDITTYQITVPVQPGNSGGPLFDSAGNIIGIINAKHLGAENASYAIKTNYLFNLTQGVSIEVKNNDSNSLANKNLAQQVKIVKDYVYIIEVN